MPKVGREISTWDEYEMMEEEVKYRLNNWEDLPVCDKKPDEDEIRKEIYNNTDYLEAEWDYYTEYLSEILHKKNPDGYWQAIVNGFGWRNLDGHKVLHAENGVDFLRAILPNTQCTFKIYNYGKGIAIQNWHHDSPTGNEWYYITPIAYSTWEANHQGT